MPDDFQYVKLPDGSYGKFAANATDDVIRSAITKDFPDAYGKTQQTLALVSPEGRGNTSFKQSPTENRYASDVANPTMRQAAMAHQAREDQLHGAQDRAMNSPMPLSSAVAGSDLVGGVAEIPAALERSGPLGLIKSAGRGLLKLGGTAAVGSGVGAAVGTPFGKAKEGAAIGGGAALLFSPFMSDEMLARAPGGRAILGDEAYDAATVDPRKARAEMDASISAGRLQRAKAYAEMQKDLSSRALGEIGSSQSNFPKPLRPLVGTPEEWSAYDQQMGILKPEASDAGTYHAARGSTAKRTNLQQRIGKVFGER